ncbi:MAG TPA: hypothetical protein VIW68_02295, partial [Candidatus Sulfotelmatobacter sp.]
MGASKKIAIVTLALVCAGVIARAQNSGQSPAPASSPSSPQTAQPTGTAPVDASAASAGKTSTQVVHEKTGPNSSRTIRHTRVVEAGSQPPELTQAEDALQKHDYAAAEP